MRAEDKAKLKKLKLWNGRGHSKKYDQWHFYICARNANEACKFLQEASGMDRRGFKYELQKYYHKGCWGNSMQHIEPEPGLWAQKSYNSPIVRLV